MSEKFSKEQYVSLRTWAKEKDLETPPDQLTHFVKSQLGVQVIAFGASKVLKAKVSDLEAG